MDLASAPAPARWFEFLLEPDRLKQHLEASNCDPSPTQLINLFLRYLPTLEASPSNVQSPNTLKSNSINLETNGKPNNVISDNGTPQSLTSSPTTSTSSSAPSSPSSSSSSEDIAPRNGTNQELSENVTVTSDPADIHIPSDSYEAKYRSKKAYALQTLAIKVASFLKWDLNVICNNLTIPVQYKLVQALTKASSTEDCPAEVKKFAHVLHAHWFLRSAIDFQLSSLQPQSQNTTIIYLSQLQQQQQVADNNALYSMKELFAPQSKQLETCSTELKSYIWDLVHKKDNSAKRFKSSAHPFKKVKLCRPNMDCFNLVDKQLNDWTECEAIDAKEFIEAACYDLGRFYFFEESYDMARQTFEIIKDSSRRFTNLAQYMKSASDLSEGNKLDLDISLTGCDLTNKISESRRQTERYLFDCMTQFSKSRKNEQDVEIDEEFLEDSGDFPGDSDLRFNNQQQTPITSGWYLNPNELVQPLHLMEGARGDALMAQGNFKAAMGCFVGALMLMTDYFRFFSKHYVDEEPYVSRMIQCSISLSCFTQAVALCQMTKNLNYTIAFKQLNERVCNDCCDDIYECIWNVTLLEYIINLHSKRGEVERRTKVIQLIGQLELNENNPEEILKEAEHVRRGKFFRILSNKYSG